MPAFNILRVSLTLALVVLSIFVIGPTIVNANAFAGYENTRHVNMLIDYGNGTLVWYNNTSVPSSWNYYNVTTLVTGGNIGAVYYASFDSHYVYSINGVGCPASNIFCDQAWGFWTLDGICWDLPSVGVDQILVSQVRTVAWFLNPVATFGNTTPTGTFCQTVGIQVNPYTNQSTVNLRAPKIRVAILSTGAFNATEVNPTTVRFGREGTEASPIHWYLQDLYHNGTIDMVLQFKTRATGIQEGDTQAILMGRTVDGTPFRGFASIVVVNGG